MLEFEIVFQHILERLPRLALIRPPVWRPRFVLRGLKALPGRA